MSTSSMSTSTAPGPTDPSTAGTTNDEGSTTDQAKHAASVASDEAKQVASDVRDQARGILLGLLRQQLAKRRIARQFGLELLAGIAVDRRRFRRFRIGPLGRVAACGPAAG